MFTVELVFSDDLGSFLRREWRQEGNTARRTLTEKTAVKDVIESCGVPHTEVDLIVVGEMVALDFSWQVEASIQLHVHGAPAPASLLPEAPRLQARHQARFVADGHLGKLVRNLRLLGFDVAYERDADDPRLREVALAEDRALLTRDRPLLMHSVVQHGYCPRSDQHEQQTREVLRRFGLLDADAPSRPAPFSRCLRCNSLLELVPKAEVLALLADEPLTLRYYDDFHRCPGCQSIYWPGTHAGKLSGLVERLLNPDT